MKLDFEGLELNFEGNGALINSTTVKLENGEEITLKLYARKEIPLICYEAEIDGVSWFSNYDLIQAMILYRLLVDHIAEYQEYFDL